MSSTNIDFLYLSEKDMIEAGVLDAKKCVETMADVNALLSEGDTLEGGKNHAEHGIMMGFPKESPFPDFPLDVGKDRRFMAMPAYVGGRFHMAGQKWYGSNSFNKDKGLPRSILMVTLNDVDTGAPIAFMSGNLLSAMRTGAQPGLAAKLLAKPDSKTLGLIGCGVVQRTTVMAIMANFDIETIYIKGYSMTSKSALELKEFIEKEYPAVRKVELVDSYEAAMKNADIVSEAVSVEQYKHPVLKPEWVKKGSVFISSGSCEFPDEFVAKGMTCVVDNVGMYEGYLKTWQEYDKVTGKRKPSGCAGLHMLNCALDGLMDKKDMHTLGGIVRGADPARTSEDEIFFVGVGGMPVLDVAWGHDVYETAKEKGIGTKLNLWDTPFLA